MEHTKHDAVLDEDTVERRKALFNLYVVPHLNLVFKLTSNYSFYKNDVQDNYNEVLINFYKYIETYDTSRSIQTWLHIVTKRLVNDLNQKNSRIKINESVNIREIEDDLIEVIDKTEKAMTEDNYEQHYNDDILSALNKLRPIYKEALILKMAGYRLSEIAKISFENGNLKKLNVETIKSRIHLAKNKMKKLINRDGEARIIEKDVNDLQQIDEEGDSDICFSE